MADTGDSFITYLEAYGDSEELSAVHSNDPKIASDARITAIIKRHREDFDAWLKCPHWMKMKYSNKIPKDILKIAAANINFTDADAIEAEQRFVATQTEENKDAVPPSDLPQLITSNPVYQTMQKCGITLTKKHMEQIENKATTIVEKGYEMDDATLLAFTSIVRQEIFKQIQDIDNNPNISQEEKESKLNFLREEFTGTRQLDHAIIAHKVLPEKIQKMELNPNIAQEEKNKKLIELRAKYEENEQVLARLMQRYEQYRPTGRTLPSVDKMPETHVSTQSPTDIQIKIQILRHKLAQHGGSSALSQEARYELRKKRLNMLHQTLSPERFASRQAKETDREKIMAARLGIIPELKMQTLRGTERVITKDEKLFDKDGKLNEQRVSKEQYQHLLKYKTPEQGK